VRSICTSKEDLRLSLATSTRYLKPYSDINSDIAPVDSCATLWFRLTLEAVLERYSVAFLVPIAFLRQVRTFTCHDRHCTTMHESPESPHRCELALNNGGFPHRSLFIPAFSRSDAHIPRILSVSKHGLRSREENKTECNESADHEEQARQKLLLCGLVLLHGSLRCLRCFCCLGGVHSSAQPHRNRS